MNDKKARSRLTPAMKTVVAIVAVLVAGGAIAVPAVLSTAGGPDAAPAPASAQHAGSGPRTTAPPPVRGPLPEATPTTGSEVLPPTAVPRPFPPKITPAPPLIAAPLPASAARRGGLVNGFPTTLMAPIGSSRVVSSSIATEGTTMQVSLVAISTASHAAITKHYEQLWTSRGLRPGATDAGGIAYSGGYASLTLAFGASGTGNQYSLYAVFRTK